jgi:hypothetical protein
MTNIVLESIQPTLADEVAFDSGPFMLLAGGPPEWPSYELADKVAGTISYFPTGSREARLIVQQIKAWSEQSLAPMEIEVLGFLGRFAGINATPLVIQ